MQQWRLRLPAMQSKSVLDGAPRKLIAPNHAAPPQQEGAVPATGQNTLRLPKCALSAPSQRKPLESHDLVTTPRVHHACRRAAAGWPVEVRAQQSAELVAALRRGLLKRDRTVSKSVVQRPPGELAQSSNADALPVQLVIV